MKLELIAGAGDTSVYYLYDEHNFYCGRLRQYNGQWVFDASKKGEGLKVEEIVRLIVT